MGLFGIILPLICVLACNFLPISSRRFSGRYSIGRSRIPPPVIYDVYDDYSIEMRNPYARQKNTVSQTKRCPGKERANGFRIGYRWSRVPSGWPWHQGVEPCIYGFKLMCPGGTEISVEGKRGVTGWDQIYTTGTIRRWHFWKTRGKYFIFKIQVFGDDVWPSPIWQSQDWPAGPKDITTTGCTGGQGARGFKVTFKGERNTNLNSI